MANLKRLKRLVLVLERVKADPKKRRQFSLDSWKTKDECGTHMCMCGWGASDPVLRRQGLHLERDDFYDGEVSYDLIYGDFSDTEAAAYFFEIDNNDAYRLFHPDSYPWGKRNSLPYALNRLNAFIRKAERAQA